MGLDALAVLAWPSPVPLAPSLNPSSEHRNGGSWTNRDGAHYHFDAEWRLWRRTAGTYLLP